MKSFGATIRNARELKKMTQSDVAKKVGVETATVSRWENDKQRNLKASHIEGLSKALDIDSVKLMELDVNRPEVAITFEPSKEQRVKEMGQRVLEYGARYDLHMAQAYVSKLPEDQLTELEEYIQILRHSGGSN